MKLLYFVDEKNPYSTIKEVLKAHFNISERLLLKLKRNNKILLNNQITNINTNIKNNDLIQIFLDFEEDNSNILPTKMNLDIIYEDEAFIIINKPAGIPVHPSIEHYTDSLSNGLKYYYDLINLKKKIRPVNRLDRDTSGLVIFAKNEYIQECLIKQMNNNIFYKEYIALCEGNFTELDGIINKPIARKQDSIIERCISPNGDKAITEYKVLSYNKENNISVVQCILKTGRTHQIRVHMKSIGHPILGDTLYGNSSNIISRQALHAYKICFYHPLTKQCNEFIAPTPKDIEQLIL